MNRHDLVETEAERQEPEDGEGAARLGGGAHRDLEHEHRPEEEERARPPDSEVVLEAQVKPRSDVSEDRVGARPGRRQP